jgi:hypothetical protein
VNEVVLILLIVRVNEDMDYERKYAISETMLVFSAIRCQYANYISTRFTAVTSGHLK